MDELAGLKWWVLWRTWLCDIQQAMEREGQFVVCFRPRPSWLR